MDRQTFIEHYQNAYGEDPPEQLVREYLGEEEHSQQSFKRYERYPQNPSNELLMEINGIFSEVARSARYAINNKKPLLKTNSLSEMHFVVLYLIAKGFIYMIFRQSYDAGIDLSGL